MLKDQQRIMILTLNLPIYVGKFAYLSSCIDFIMTIHMSNAKYRC